MANANMKDYSQRISRIMKQHNKLSKGFVTTVNQNGLIEMRPRRQARSFPWRGLMLTLLLLMMFKAYVYISLGPSVYNSRVNGLRNGTIIEQAGAFLMQEDPVTVWVTQKLTPLFP